jgi:hypothetical protein
MICRVQELVLGVLTASDRGWQGKVARGAGWGTRCDPQMPRHHLRIDDWFECGTALGISGSRTASTRRPSGTGDISRRPASVICWWDLVRGRLREPPKDYRCDRDSHFHQHPSSGDSGCSRATVVPAPERATSCRSRAPITACRHQCHGPSARIATTVPLAVGGYFSNIFETRRLIRFSTFDGFDIECTLFTLMPRHTS